MSENQAAWLTAKGAKPLAVGDIPPPKPGPGEIVIKNVAVAINAVDWKIQDYGVFVQEYPFVLGDDAAGVVQEVGEGVTRFKKGQRVLAHCLSLRTGNFAHSAFQLYPVASEILTAPIPDSMSFDQAVVLPLALSTAASALYQKEHLALPYPTTTPKPTDKTILVWGGSSSVGSAAIQLALASGFAVVTTTSPKNFEFVGSLGATTVMDYKNPALAQQLCQALKEKQLELVGVFDAVSETPTFEKIAALLRDLDLAKKKIRVAAVLPSDKTWEEFDLRPVFAANLADEPNKHAANAVWRDYVPDALRTGQLKALPEPMVVGKGLQNIQHAMDVQRGGVSAKKVVVSI